MRKLTLAATLALSLLTAGLARAGDPLPGYSDTLVVDSLSNPTAIAFLPNGNLLIAQKAGALKMFDGVSTTTLVTIPVCSSSEMGLLGIAVDPNFNSNGHIYLYRTHQGTPNPCSATGRVNEVVRVTMSGGTIDLASLTVLLTGARTDDGNHDGGCLRIGPGNLLFVGVGDTGNGDNQGCPGSSTNPYSQDLTELEGKVLRLNLDGTPAAGNPFIGMGSDRGEIFAYGFRNPFRFGFDPVNNALWLADVGDLAFEEIDIVTSGGNYGWPHCEATFPTGCELPGDIDPIFAYSHDGGCPGESTLPSLGTSIIGGTFASSLFVGLENDYIFGDYTGNRIYHAVVNGTRTGITGSPSLFVDNAAGPVDIITGPDGALYYVAITDGQVRRVAPTFVAPTNIDHYLCYNVRLAMGQPRFPSQSHQLEDQFDVAPRPFDLKSIVSICNPAVKDGSALPDPNTHQEGYHIRAPMGSPRFVKSNHQTFDQFALRNLTVTAPDSLLVPSNKVPGNGGAPPYSATDVDHYKCYRAKLQQGEPRFVPPAPPSVTDQFFTGGQTVEVKRVSKLCNPVSKDGSAINHPESHLVCYKVKLPQGTPRFIPQTVSTNNQIRADVLIASRVAELCLPAEKDHP